MYEQNFGRNLTPLEPQSTRRVGRPAVGWLKTVEGDLRTMGARNWRRKSQESDQWKAILKERLTDYSARGRKK
jgi:hypothetical protein